jgi:hypothetical protein
MKRPLHLLVVTFALLSVMSSANCGSRQQPTSNTIVLSYKELGPQVAVYKLIGYEWYQWNSQGSDDPTKLDDVKVVVYRNVSLEKVKEMYPVIKEKQDYRYIDYSTAMDYLNQNENQPYLEHLRTTKRKIIAQLGS